VEESGGEIGQEVARLRVLIGELLELRRQLLTALDSRVVIEQAKGVLAERLAIPVEDAFRVLRRAARSTHTKIHDLALEVVESPETPAAILDASAVTVTEQATANGEKRRSDVRVAENEALFRRVNEQLESVERLLGADDPVQLLCECGDTECADIIVTSRAEYESVRSNPRHFIVLRGHDDPPVERVVRERPTYLVVEKQGAAGSIAERTDSADK